MSVARAGGVENAAIYGVDRAYCGLYVDQNWINQELRIGALERHVSVAQAVELAISSMDEIKADLNKRPLEQVVAYCALRTKPSTTSQAGKNF